jgi:hypothetical protein
VPDHPNFPRTPGFSSAFAPLLLTPLVLLVHGYHPFAGDAGIYVAGVHHILDSSLYPVNAAFPAAFTRLSVFPWMLAALAHLTHLQLAWILLVAYLFSIYLFLFACRRLATRLFSTESARWYATLVAAACFTLPIAGTALFIMDPYITARSFSTPISLLALSASIDRAWPRTVLLLLLAMLIHPLMGAYAAVFVLLDALIATEHTRLALLQCSTLFATAGAVFLLTRGTPITPAWREAIDLPQRTFLFLTRWRWYEVSGLLLPLLLYTLAMFRLRVATATRALCLACLLSGITSLLIAALFVPPTGPWTLIPLQVLRSFHLIYTAGLVLCGGVLAQLTSRSRVAGFSLLALVFASMATAQSRAWPACHRIEWPGARPSNPWQQAFLWIRDNTPRGAVFAFNPELVYLPLEDEQGFRAIAERDHLADDKDAGIVVVLPQLADRWALQRNAQLNVDGMADNQRIGALTPLGATWLLLPPQAKTALPCPWNNAVVLICRMRK